METVKIQSKEGHQAFVLRESVENYVNLGWKELKNTDEIDPGKGEGQPLADTLKPTAPEKK